MAADADGGLMLWDVKCRGTLTNIRRLVAAGKPVVVYLSADHACHTIQKNRSGRANSAHKGVRGRTRRLAGQIRATHGAAFLEESAGHLANQQLDCDLQLPAACVKGLKPAA